MLRPGDLVAAVCDRAHEHAGRAEDWLHWAVPDPALHTAATNLRSRFDGIFGTIERFLYSGYDQFASRAAIPNFLPLLAERFARQRLTALARVEGKMHDGQPVVLFLCTHNAGRSQIAMGFFQHLAGENAVAWSGGTEPADQVNPAAVSAMNEVGIDISTHGRGSPH